MTTQRRSRIRRMSIGKRIALTPRDLEIFRALAQYRYLRATYIHAFVGGASETRFKERLGDLFHEGFIDRAEKQWEFADAACQSIVYELGAGARRVLADAGSGSDEARTILTPNAHRQYSHSLLVCECLASIELATRTLPGIRFIPWGEILAKAPVATRATAMPLRIAAAAGAVVPDGLFGLEYQSETRKTYRFFALEADRNTMPISRSDKAQTSYLGKLEAYATIIADSTYKAQWGVPNLLVLSILSSERRMSGILAGLAQNMAGSPVFLLKALDRDEVNMPQLGLLHRPWARAGLPPLRIDE